MPKPVVDPEKCVGCGTCVQVCPVGVYELQEGKAVPVNADQCIGCKACEVQCPSQAITVEED
ncbi:MAG: ferredoxin [Candidatus Methanomethylicota archaeon]|uniref:Ferredoxin n=1 Tax=Thermoproteota archaeon TaxID=2056631 RepID=A0A497EVF9_9CREN|nr:MAG: ferredoxin [Candidatus Verstraetearchaeota archaeon]